MTGMGGDMEVRAGQGRSKQIVKTQLYIPIDLVAALATLPLSIAFASAWVFFQYRTAGGILQTSGFVVYNGGGFLACPQSKLSAPPAHPR